MLIHHLLLSVTTIATISCIRFDNINVKLFDNRDSAFELKLSEALRTTKNFFATEDAALIANIGSKAGNFIPYVGKAAAVLPVLQGILAHQSDWKEPLIKAISDETERAIALNDINNMESSVRTIEANIKFLNKSREFTSASKTTIVHNLHDAIYDIINKFAHERSAFRKNSLFAIPLLFSIASLVPIYNRIEEILVPVLADESILGCKLENVLLEYKPRAAFIRMSKVGYTIDITNDYIQQLLDKHALMNDAMNSKLNNFDRDLDCESNQGDEIDPERRNMYKYYFNDEFADGRGYIGSVECFEDFLKYIRHRVERAFDDVLELVSGSCSTKKRSRKRNLTGYGWLTMVIQGSKAFNKRDSSSACDGNSVIGFITGRKKNLCDQYVIVKSGEREIFRTSVKDDTSFAVYMETGISPLIRKNDPIIIEIWDDDTGWSKDDLLFRIERTIEQFLEGTNYFPIPNFVIARGFWQDEYDAE